MEKRKVGLLTYHHTTNFGSLLQTYGLYKKVNELGYDCEIVNYINELVENREVPKKFFEFNGLETFKNMKNYFKYEPTKKKKDREFNTFLNSKMRVSEKCFNAGNISEANKIYDTFLVGSDLVWDDSINGADRNFMLEFTEDSKNKIAYASSTGKFWDKDVEKVSALLNRFKHIGVRESEIQEQLNKELDIDVDFVGDPTILIEPSEWEKMATDKMIEGEYVLIYFNDNELKIYEDALKYCKERNLPLYAISYSWLPEGINPIRPTRLQEFLSLIKNANTVFTASYHGMLFSIYFNKTFYYYNRGWKSRMRSIAEYLCLENREHYTENNCAAIDYEEVNNRMNALRKKSVECLENYLKD